MIKFGPSGNCESFYAEGFSHTEEAAAFVKNRGLDCFEYSFGRGITLSPKTAEETGLAFYNNGIELSLHAPYYISLSSVEEEKRNNSIDFLVII